MTMERATDGCECTRCIARAAVMATTERYAARWRNYATDHPLMLTPERKAMWDKANKS